MSRSAETVPVRPPRRSTSAAIAAGVVVLDLCLFLAATAALGGARNTASQTRLIVDEPSKRWVDPTATDGTFVRSIGAVELDPNALKLEPIYLDTISEFRDWRRMQARLHQALSAGPTVRVTRCTMDLHTCSATDEPVMRVGLARALTTVPTVFAGVILVGMAVFVFVRRPGELAAVSLLLLSQGTLLCAVPTALNALRTTFPPAWTSLFIFVNRAGVLAGGLAILSLATSFPASKIRPSLRRIVDAVLVVLAVAALAVDQLSWTYQASADLTFALLVATLVALPLTWRRLDGQVQRLQVRWVLWGLAVPIGFMTLFRTVPLLVGLVTGRPAASDVSDAVAFYAALSMPIGIGIAILRERLLDIELVVRKTIVGAIVAPVTLFAYYLAISVLAGGTIAGRGESTVQAAFLTAVVLAFVALPMQTRLEGVLDRTFFRNRYHYRRVLRLLPAELTRLASTDQTATEGVHRLSESMGLERCIVALVPETVPMHWRRGHVEPPTDPAFWRVLGDAGEGGGAGGAILSDSLAHADDPVAAWLQQHHMAVAIPIRTLDRLVGVLGLSAPGARSLILADDIELLQAVASSLALSLSRSLAYETIRRLNEDLEERIRVRTAELEKVRLQLFQWEKMSSLAVLSAGLAHELNTPLGVARSTAEQLLDGLKAGSTADNTRLLRLAELCREASIRASEIVQNLREFSSPGQVDPVDTTLSANVESTLRLLEPRLSAARVEVALELEPVAPVRCYSALVNQLLLNLVGNAVDVMPDGGRLTVRLWQHDADHAAIAISDTGPGIDRKLRDRIFEPFFTTKGTSGTGLGLAICYSIVELHGGRIWEEGRRPGGARFVFTLPTRNARQSGRLAPLPPPPAN